MEEGKNKLKSQNQREEVEEAEKERYHC